MILHGPLIPFSSMILVDILVLVVVGRKLSEDFLLVVGRVEGSPWQLLCVALGFVSIWDVSLWMKGFWAF